MNGDQSDVQFSNLDAQRALGFAAYGFAAFDHAQVRDAVHFDAKCLAFAK